MSSNSLQEKIGISADADPVLFHGAIFLQSVLHVIHMIVKRVGIYQEKYICSCQMRRRIANSVIMIQILFMIGSSVVCLPSLITASGSFTYLSQLNCT